MTAAVLAIVLYAVIRAGQSILALLVAIIGSTVIIVALAVVLYFYTQRHQ